MVFAEITCPRPGCGQLLAQLLRDGEGRLAVRHRDAGAERDPSVRAGDIETRDLQPPVAVEHGPEAGSVQLWVCPCRDVRCGVVFVLDDAQLRQVLGHVHRRRTPLCWRPDAAAVERSRRLWPRTHSPMRPEERLVPSLGQLPPIARGDLRPIRVRPPEE